MILIPDISVCVVTYNQQRYIEQCLRSVIEQKVNARMEILVGDDCSNDQTGEIVRALSGEYPDMLHYFRRPDRLGASRNLKELLKAARGNLVARIDGDDYWLPGKLQAQVEYMQTHPGCSAVYTNAIVLAHDDTPYGLFNNVGDAAFSLSDMVRKGNFLNNSSVLFRKQSIPDWLAIEEQLIDYRINLLHARYGYLGHIGEPLTVYRRGAPGSIVNQNNDAVRQLYWEALNSVPGNLVSAQDLANGMADFMRRVVFRSVRKGRPGLVLYWWGRVLGKSPVGSFSMSILLARAIARTLFLEIFYALKSLNGRRKKILYAVKM